MVLGHKFHSTPSPEQHFVWSFHANSNSVPSLLYVILSDIASIIGMPRPIDASSPKENISSGCDRSRRRMALPHRTVIVTFWYSSEPPVIRLFLLESSQCSSSIDSYRYSCRVVFKHSALGHFLQRSNIRCEILPVRRPARSVARLRQPIGKTIRQNQIPPTTILPTALPWSLRISGG